VDSRIALSGNGGDQFFSVSPVFLADLLRTGRWGTWAREAKAIGLGLRQYRQLFHWSLQPTLPPALLHLATWIRGGRSLRAHLQARVPDWFRTDTISASSLMDRQWQYGLRRAGESFGSAETAWYLRSSFGQWVVSTATGFTQQEGVELRSPMYDRRVIEFIARRPREDRFAAGETKRLLRQAMAGLLPAEHLARRPRRTGLPGGYLRRCMTEALPRWLDAVYPDLRVAELGLVEPRVLRATLDRYLANPKWESTTGVQVFDVLSLENWIRAHAEVGTQPVAMVA
jgi:asparagine synthase (glutamine-hydrolysing)